MSLRLYMLLSTIINMTLFSSLAAGGVLLKKLPPRWEFAILCPVIVLMLQYRAVWPKAKALPLQARESFWSYRSANAGTWMLVAVLLISMLAPLFGL